MADRGLHADLRALIDQDDVEDARGDQLSLEIFDDFASPVAQRLADRNVAQRGPGRPPGSKNRAGLNVVQLIKATKRPALLALKEWSDLNLTEFMAATGIEKPKEAFDSWLRVTELVAAYEEGRPTQRVELDGKLEVLPVAIFGDAPVRPDLVNGNPPQEGELINVTNWADISNNDMESDQGSQPKAHDDDESQWSPDGET